MYHCKRRFSSKSVYLGKLPIKHSSNHCQNSIQQSLVHVTFHTYLSLFYFCFRKSLFQPKAKRGIPFDPIFIQIFSSRASLLPGSCHPPSEDSVLHGHLPHVLLRSAYPQSQFPSSFSAAGLR